MVLSSCLEHCESSPVQCANISSNLYNMLLLPLLLLLLVQILVLVSVKPADFSALNQIVPGLQSTTTEGWTLWT